MRCNVCNGECESIGGGKYKCRYCGSVISEDIGAKSYASRRDGGAKVFEENINGILEITWEDEKYLHSGSGFLVDERGYAITNAHVVTHEDGSSCRTVSVKLCGKNLTATVEVLGDSRHASGNGVDLALIKLSALPQGAKPLVFEDFNRVRIGEQVFVVGNSLGYGTCITSGIVSDKARLVNGKMLLMTDCAVNGGNSGGPIFNAEGKVIGAIVSGIDNAEGMNFAIPASTVQEFLRQKSRASSMFGAYQFPQAGSYGRPYSGSFERPTNIRPPKCPRCSGDSERNYKGGFICKKCGYEWTTVRKANAPCPDCNSKNTIVENGIFYCVDCGYEGF